MKGKNKLQKLFYEQFRENKFCEIIVNKSNKIVWMRLNIDASQTLVNIYKGVRLFSRWRMVEEKETVGTTPLLTSTTLNILKIWLPDKKTTLFSFCCVEGDQGKIFNERTLNPFVSLENNSFAFMINHRYASRV